MANIAGSTTERVIPIKRWYGLNENPDGDTKLAYGEAANMRNFQVTRDGNLKLRDGTDLLEGLCQTYTLNVSNDVTLVLEGDLYRLTMYPSASAGNGTVVLSGVSAEVTIDNWDSYVNYYWRGGAYKFWKFVKYEEGKWYMKAVTVSSSSTNQKVAGLWYGKVGGTDYLLAACDGKLYKIVSGTRSLIGSIDTTSTVHIFGFSNKAYIMDGKKYMEWDGSTYTELDGTNGYVPIVLIATAPAGGGTELEQINKLSKSRKVWFSGDGSSLTYQLPEVNLASIDKVFDRAGNQEITSNITKNTTTGQVVFDAGHAPAAGTNNIEITYTVSTGAVAEIQKMRFSELFNGAQDNRVFLYGDGTNKVLYSGVDYDGKPRADYFPDMNVADIGAANTPVTGLLRHYSWLIAFKTDSTYGISYGDITLEDSRVIPGFTIKPINRAIGNAAMGQVRLVNNQPRTLHGQDCYEWATSYNQTDDERLAKRISDRVYKTISEFNIPDCVCWDDDYGQEFYIAYDGRALVHNYAADAWYLYTDFDALCFASVEGKLYFGTSKGEVRYLDPDVRSDCGAPIDAYWESGSMDFSTSKTNADYLRKYSAQMWVGLKPTDDSEITVTVQTDKKSVYTEKVVQKRASTFVHADFNNWTFVTNYKPFMQRLKIKAKKFVYYKLIFKSLSDSAFATVVAVDIRVRFNGYVR